MCGIFGVIHDPSGLVAQTVLKGLKKLEYRGYDSWGIAIIPRNRSRLLLERHVGKIGTAQTSLPASWTGIGHTRWATHGGVTDENAHPHVDCYEKIAVIHNGIVENYQKLKTFLIKRKHTFSSETDTEVTAHLIEEQMKKHDFTTSVITVFNELIGSNAIAVLNVKTNEIVACRNGSPLVVGIAGKTSYLASDITAFLQYTKKVIYLKDGEAVRLSTQGITLFDLATKKILKKRAETINWNSKDTEKGGYPYFMLKEIMEQKKTISKTASLNEKEYQELESIMKNASRIFLIGCGSAHFCATAGQYFFADAGVFSHAIGAYEFLPYAKFCDKKSVVIAISQSGETAETIIAVKAAKYNGSHIVGIINAQGSTLERLADTVLSVGAGPEIAVVSTKAFTAQLSTLYLLSRSVMGTMNEGKQTIIKLGKELDQWLNSTLIDKIIRLSKKYFESTDMYIIGKYINYPAAQECAIKIKESSYIHGEAFASGELKHGVITLIEKNTPCIALLGNDVVKDEVLSSATQLKTRGGTIIGIAPFKSDVFDHHIATFDTPLSIIPNVIFGQLFAYYLAVGRGNDPDKPRNLAKSVTVK